MDYRLGNPAQKLVYHNCLIFFGNRIECLLHNMTTKSVHAQVQRITANGVRDGNDLFWSSMLEAALDEEVAKAVDHEWICLGDNGLHNLILLFDCANFKLLLQEDGSLLVVVAYDLVDNVFPVARHIAVKKAAVIQRLRCGNVGMASNRRLKGSQSHSK